MHYPTYINMKISPRRLAHAAGFLLVSSVLVGNAGAAAVALQNITLGGVQETVAWEGGSLGGYTTVQPSTYGVGTIAPVAPGYSASAGYYSFMGDYGLVASTSIQNSAIFTDIQNVVFQQVSMGTGVGALGFKGGPVLELFNGSTLIDVTVPVTYSAMGPGVEGSGGGFSGTYAAAMFQWDLSGITETVTSVRVTSPIPAHSSTIEARLDIGGGAFVQVIPEPSTALLGGIGILFLARRRR